MRDIVQLINATSSAARNLCCFDIKNTCYMTHNSQIIIFVAMRSFRPASTNLDLQHILPTMPAFMRRHIKLLPSKNSCVCLFQTATFDVWSHYCKSTNQFDMLWEHKHSTSWHTKDSCVCSTFSDGWWRAWRKYSNHFGDKSLLLATTRNSRELIQLHLISIL
jgi:hypothetical protein